MENVKKYMTVDLCSNHQRFVAVLSSDVSPILLQEDPAWAVVVPTQLHPTRAFLDCQCHLFQALKLQKT
jgi:hypothetical protein